MISSQKHCHNIFLSSKDVILIKGALYDAVPAVSEQTKSTFQSLEAHTHSVKLVAGEPHVRCQQHAQ